MLLKECEHKCKLLKIHWDKSDTDRLLQRTKQILDLDEWTCLLSPGARTALQFDLLYCLWRHRIFLESSLFLEVLADFIHSQYQVPRVKVDELVSESLGSMNKMTLPQSSSAGDSLNRDFLKYVFIASATATDDNSLITDLGLGTSLIKRIKVIAESLIANPVSPKSTINFEPLLDDIMRDIMLSISEELKATPWIIDVYGLDYLLRLTRVEKSRSEIALPVTSIFQVLLGIGREGIVSFGALSECCRKIPEMKGIDSDEKWLDAVKTLSGELLAYDLIFEESRDPILSKKTYRLTEAAQRLTCDAFACKFLRMKEPEFERIAKMYPLYQIALIRRIPDHMKRNFMEECRRSAAVFSPRAIDVAMRSLARGLDHDELMKIFIPILDNPQAMAFTKSAVMRGLGSFYKSNEVSIFLRRQSQSQHLPEKLRQTAKIALTNIEKRASKPVNRSHDSSLQVSP